MLQVRASTLALLSTGTLLNVLSQLLVSSKDFADKNAQVMPWIRYTATLLPAAASRARARRQVRGSMCPAPASVTPQQRTALQLIGLLDVLAYSLFCLAYFSLGAGASNLLLAACSQILTALATRFLLRRRLNTGQWTGIGTILAGLALRALPAGGSSAGGSSSGSSSLAQQAEQWRGVLMIVAAACLYTAIGILYERLTKGAAKAPAHSEIMWHTSLLGFLLSTGYQLVYTLPRFDSLVLRRMAANRVAPSELLPLLLAFGSMFNLHMLAQSLVFRTEGAIGVGVINSVRGAVLTVVTSLLFCEPQRPWLCINAQSGASAAVTTLGGIIWVLCEPKARQVPSPPMPAGGVGGGGGPAREGEGPEKDKTA